MEGVRTIQIQITQQEYDKLKEHLKKGSIRAYAKFVLLKDIEKLTYTNQEVIDRRNQGATYGEIAKQFSISKQKAHYIYKRGADPIDKRKEQGKARGDINRPKKNHS